MHADQMIEEEIREIELAADKYEEMLSRSEHGCAMGELVKGDQNVC